MIDDDDRKPAPASPESAAGDADKTPSPPAGEEPKGEQPETGDTTTSDEDVDVTLDDEDDEQDDDEGDEDAGEGDEPKRKASRTRRYNQRIRELEAQNEALRSRDGGRLPPSNEQALLFELERRVRVEIGDPPRQEDFKDAEGKPDFVAFHNEQQAWLTDRRHAVREVRKDLIREVEQAQFKTADLVDAHKRRVAKFKTKVKDFDEVMSKADMPVAPHVERIILHSKHSEKISYVLAKNQSKLAQLNRMDPEAVAREVGRIEGRLSLPPPKQPTKARKPITPLRGGGTSPQSQTAARDAWLKKTYGDRA